MMLLDNIRHLCKSRGLKLSEVEQKAGLAGKTIFRWDKTSPSIEKVAAVADVLGVSVDELLGRELKPTPPDERELIRIYRELNREGKAAAVAYLRFLRMQPAYIKSADAGEVEAV